MGELMFYIKLLALHAALLAAPFTVNAVCYFPIEMQGEYITQLAATHTVSYTNVNITEDTISIWGLCHRRNGNNIVLRMDSDEASCYKCIHLNLVSRNILRVYTDEHDSSCYTNEEKAISSCATDTMLDDQPTHKEVILYKTLEYNGQEIKRQYCPFNGRYRFMLTIDDGAPEPIGCNSHNSELDNCPSGSSLNLRFRQCEHFPNEATLECLGQWKGQDGQNFLALMNTGYSSFGPKYRCATFVTEPDSHVITISLNADSLCSVRDMYDRKEILELYPFRNHSFDHHKYQYQKLPAWMHGEFEFLTIDADQIMYRDQSSFKTYTMKVISYHNADSIESSTSVRLLTFSQTQCGEEQYQCVAIHKRSKNVLEFQIGSKTIHQSTLNDSNRSISNNLESICSNKYFDKSHFMTQVRLDSAFEMSPCPIDGEFVGLIPDAEDLCARLLSDCDRNDTMNYQVSFCGHDEIFDERKYQCLGQWTENNIIYTYAKRLDVPIYECFLGALASTEEIFIKEAGEHCRRDIDPYRYSMQLNKTAACPKKPTRMDVHVPREYDEKLSSTSSSYESTLTVNGELEYEYFEESRMSIGSNGNGNSNVPSPTVVKVQVPTKETSTEHSNTVDDRAHNELNHPIHPKLNVDVDRTRTENTNNTTHNRSKSLTSDHTVMLNILPLMLLLLMLNY